MAKSKLNFKFLNPNTAEDTACMLIDFLIGINMPKAEKAIKNAVIEKGSAENHPV